jgi:hypothetical protein
MQDYQLRICQAGLSGQGWPDNPPLWRVAEKRLSPWLGVTQYRGPDIPARGRIIRPPHPGESSKRLRTYRGVTQIGGPDIPARGRIIRPPRRRPQIRLRTIRGVTQMGGGADNPASRIIRANFGRIIRPSKSATTTFWEGL